MNLTKRKNVYPLWIVIELDYEMFRNFRPHINVIESIINPLGWEELSCRQRKKIMLKRNMYSVATQSQKIEVIETMTKFQWLQPCNTVFTAVHISYIASMESMCSSLSYNYGLLQLLLRKGSNSESFAILPIELCFTLQSLLVVRILFQKLLFSF